MAEFGLENNSVLPLQLSYHVFDWNLQEKWKLLSNRNTSNCSFEVRLYSFKYASPKYRDWCDFIDTQNTEQDMLSAIIEACKSLSPQEKSKLCSHYAKLQSEEQVAWFIFQSAPADAHLLENDVDWAISNGKFHLALQLLDRHPNNKNIKQKASLLPILLNLSAF